MIRFAPRAWSRTPLRALYLAGSGLLLVLGGALLRLFPLTYFVCHDDGAFVFPLSLSICLVAEHAVLTLASRKGFHPVVAALFSPVGGFLSGAVAGTLAGLETGRAPGYALLGAGAGLAFGIVFAPANALLVKLARTAEGRGTHAALDAVAQRLGLVVLACAQLAGVLWLTAGARDGADVGLLDKMGASITAAVWVLAAAVALDATARKYGRRRWLARVARGEVAGLRVVACEDGEARASGLTADRPLATLDATEGPPSLLARVIVRNDDQPYRQMDQLEAIARLASAR